MTPSSQDYLLIPLTQGQFAKVSPHRFEELNQWKWFAQWNPNTESYYAARNSTYRRGEKRSAVRMSRVILELRDGDLRQAEHENRDTLDNTDGNLRIATQGENMRNRKKFKGCKSRFKGVSWKNREQKWYVRIFVDGKAIALGYFAPEEEEKAGAAYAEAAAKYHGEFARVG